MPFKETRQLYETTWVLELLFCPLAVFLICCLSSRSEIFFFSFFEGCYRISKSLFYLCQSNLSLLTTVVCHLMSLMLGVFFLSILHLGNWGHGEKEQLARDHTAGNWQSKKLSPSPRLLSQSWDGKLYGFQARLLLNLAKRGNLFLVQCFLTIQLGNIYIFLNTASPPVNFGMLIAWCIAGAWRRRCSTHFSTIVGFAFVYN